MFSIDTLKSKVILVCRKIIAYLCIRNLKACKPLEIKGGIVNEYYVQRFVMYRIYQIFEWLLTFDSCFYLNITRKTSVLFQFVINTGIFVFFNIRFTMIRMIVLFLTDLILQLIVQLYIPPLVHFSSHQVSLRDMTYHHPPPPPYKKTNEFECERYYVQEVHAGAFNGVKTVS